MAATLGKGSDVLNAIFAIDAIAAIDTVRAICTVDAFGAILATNGGEELILGTIRMVCQMTNALSPSVPLTPLVPFVPAVPVTPWMPSTP